MIQDTIMIDWSVSHSKIYICLSSNRTVPARRRDQFRCRTDKSGFPDHCGGWSPTSSPAHPYARSQEEKGESYCIYNCYVIMDHMHHSLNILAYVCILNLGQQDKEHSWSFHQAQEADHRWRISRVRHRLVVQILRICRETGSSDCWLLLQI